MQIKSKIKSEGQVSTPSYLVKDMLDLTGYNGIDIISKHVMENSCGDGAFLCEIVQRYCSLYSGKTLKHELETYIHGIEKDPIKYKKCLKELDNIAAAFGVNNVDWDIICDDTLKIGEKYYGKMDFVVGNPPYVRTHNMGTVAKNFTFSSKGMTDLYLVFFEIGFNMLSLTGKMCLISPSSYLNSTAGANLRNHILSHQNLISIIDLEHFQPFPVTTYTMISLFDNTKLHTKFAYYKYTAPGIINFIENLNYNDVFINGRIYLGTKNMLQKLRDMEICYLNNKSIIVKNGFATLADNIFIGDFLDGKNIINIIKSSTGVWKKCIFPYKANGDPLPEFVVQENKYVWDHLCKNRKRLESRAIINKNEWYLFGRSQALRDVSKNKISVNQLIKDKKSLKINFVPAGCGVYGGLYIVSDKNMLDIQDALISDEFFEYVCTLKKYKSGGYYTYSSVELAKFLNYYIEKRNTNELKFAANY